MESGASPSERAKLEAGGGVAWVGDVAIIESAVRALYEQTSFLAERAQVVLSVLTRSRLNESSNGNCN